MGCVAGDGVAVSRPTDDVAVRGNTGRAAVPMGESVSMGPAVRVGNPGNGIPIYRAAAVSAVRFGNTTVSLRYRA